MSEIVDVLEFIRESLVLIKLLTWKNNVIN